MSIQLGSPVKDTFTGMRGFVTARIECLDGRRMFEVQPVAKPDGSLPPASWVQEKHCAAVKSAKAASQTLVEAVDAAIDAVDETPADEPEETEVDDFTTPAKGAKAAKANSFEDDDAPAEEAEEKPAKAAKPPKAKKLTSDDVNDACKARVKRLIEEGKGNVTGKIARDNVLALLKKNFKTTSVTDIDEQEDMARAVKLLGGK